MARDVLEHEIGGLTYKVTLLGSKRGLAMSVRIVKILGPTLSSFVDGVSGGKGDGIESLALGGSDALREICARLQPDELASIAEELAKLTTVVIDDKREPRLIDIYDDHFAGHYDALMKWLAFALEVNFRSFFAGTAGVRALAVRLMALIESQSKPQTSTGTSTESPPADTTAQA